MSEKPSFNSTEQKQISENTGVVVVRLAEKAYTLFDELLRRTNADLVDFDPLGKQHRGDSEPEFPGFRPGYSRFWGGSFGFHAAVMEQQRIEMKRWQGDPDRSRILKAMDQYISTPGSDLVFAGAETPEINGILDFSSYQRHINATNKQADYTLAQIKRTLHNTKQGYHEEDDERKFVERAREAHADIPMASRIFAVMRTIRNWSSDQLKRMNHPDCDESLISEVLTIALEETERDSA